MPTPTAPDTDTTSAVFDALCLAGAPRGKTWVANFCRGLGWRTAGGDRNLTLDEVDSALQTLKAQGRIHADDGFGWQVRPDAWAARWPALRAHPQVGDFWRLWVWATNGASGRPEQPGWAGVRSDADAVALARLVLMAHPSPAAFNQLAQGVMGRAATPSALLAALTRALRPGFPDRAAAGAAVGADRRHGQRQRRTADAPARPRGLAGRRRRRGRAAPCHRRCASAWPNAGCTAATSPACSAWPRQKTR